ncbi:MAG: glycosyltransferase [Bacteroidales bacterium]|nr:glycosyltransferase [Bacteroidales bacterium]
MSEFSLTIITNLFYIISGIQFIFYFIIFGRLVFFNNKNNNTNESKKEAVSIVIVARNEYLNLKRFLPEILEQKYEIFEVVIVNHASSDETDFLIKELQQKYHNLKYVEIKQDVNFFQGKKFPLSMGIKSATNDLLLFTDADCVPSSSDWISEMVSAYKEKTEIVLSYGAYETKKGLLNKIIRFDTIRVALTYLSFAKWRIPYMGVGRNLSYRKELFYEQKGFMSHYKINSGDDDLFINKAANSKNCEIILSEKSKTISIAENSFSNWFHQKRRHLSTGNNYKISHLLLLGILELSTTLFYILSIILLIANPIQVIIISIIVLRTAIMLVIIKKFMIITNERKLLLLLPLLEIIIILITPIINLSNLLIKQRRWK